MDIFLLYLLMQADTIKDSFVVITFFGGMGTCICLVIGLIEDIKLLKKAAKVMGCIVVPSLIMATLMPSTKTIAVMVGGHYAIEATKTETAKKIMNLVDVTLENAIKDALKKRGEK